MTHRYSVGTSPSTPVLATAVKEPWAKKPKYVMAIRQSKLALENLMSYITNVYMILLQGDIDLIYFNTQCLRVTFSLW
jgi:hypothetical protein